MTHDWRLRRVCSIGAALVVAGIAAYASYSHMRHLAIQYGQDETVASLLPISVDGMLVVATLALGDGRQHRWSAWAAFWLGVTVSVVANALAAQPHVLARCISAWPAIAFLFTVEVITRSGRGTRITISAALPVPVLEPTEKTHVTAPVPEVAPVPVPPPNEVAAAPRTRRTDKELLAILRQAKRVPRDPDGTVPIRRAMDALGCGQDRARRLLAEAGLLRTGDDADNEHETVLEPAHV